MDKKEEVFFEKDFLCKLSIEIEKLSRIIEENKGTRIGQSTVCSQKMHTFHPKKPQEVNVLQDIDAGQIFYHRKEPGEVYHMDVFHELGAVDHRLVASWVCRAVAEYNDHYAALNKNHKDGQVDAHYVDIQTGTGGGRVTGNLNYGKKLSLRKSHTNHVHLAMALGKQHLSCLIYVVMAVETAILSCNLELRCNERVENSKGSSKGKMDLSAYMEKSDSLLQENNADEVLDPYEKNQEASESLENFAGNPEIKASLTPKRDGQNSPKPKRGINSSQPASSLTQKGVIDLQDHYETKKNVTAENEKHWEKYLSDIEIHLRRVMSRAKRRALQKGQSKLLQNKSSCNSSERNLQHAPAEYEPRELEISNTIQAAARRMVEKQIPFFKIIHEDLRYLSNKKRRRIEFCLLLDASSSMEGPRIRAAKLLARFLFFSTADPMSVIAFQGNRSWVQVPFTRDLGQLERGLENIKAYGETPLALGLTACLQYFQKNQVYNPFIILITDGVPTLGMTTTDPVKDALQVGQFIKRKEYGFTCIGLKPHLDYLKQLAMVAGGTIYVVDELEKEGMC